MGQRAGWQQRRDKAAPTLHPPARRALMRSAWAIPLAGAAALFVPWAAAAGSADHDRAGPPRCSGAGVRVDGDFEQAGFAACSVREGGTVELLIAPETLPINPSPWYAARLRQNGERPRRVEIVYRDARHRYAPWLSVGGGPWQRLTAEPLGSDGARVAVTLPSFSGAALLAAQPLNPLAAVRRQWADWAATGKVAEIARASSRDGRAVPFYRHGPADAPRIHVFVARQHPPETTGAVAFDAFAAALLGADPASRCPGHAFLFAPILNPDGIARGHWRTNAGRIDLNRDWAAAREPETAGIASAVQKAAAAAQLVSLLDFHSTRSNALYAPKEPSPPALAFGQAAERSGLRLVPTRADDAITLKSWAEARFGAATYTVELADGNSPESAAATGRALAEDFLTHLACPASGE